jgi:hypothetical protein
VQILGLETINTNLSFDSVDGSFPAVDHKVYLATRLVTPIVDLTVVKSGAELVKNQMFPQEPTVAGTNRIPSIDPGD